MPKFTQISPDAFEKIPINAGVLLKEFLTYENGKLSGTPDESTFKKENIIGVTSGGISFASNPNMIDFGEDMDNVPANTWQLKRCTSYNPTISGTFVTIDNELGKMLIGAAEDAVKLTTSETNTAGDKTNIYRIRPTLDMKDAFHNLWLICDYTTDNGDNGGYVALHMKNALSTGGLQWQTSKDAKGQFSFEFTGHYDLRNIDEQPFDFYIKEPDTAGDV